MEKVHVNVVIIWVNFIEIILYKDKVDIEEDDKREIVDKVEIVLIESVINVTNLLIKKRIDRIIVEVHFVIKNFKDELEHFLKKDLIKILEMVELNHKNSYEEVNKVLNLV